MRRGPAPEERVFRCLLGAYPAEFRSAFGDELVAFFRDQRRDPRYSVRSWGRLCFWYDTLRDLVVSAARQHARRWVRAAGPAVGFAPSRPGTESIPSQLLYDVGFGVRMLRQRPGFTLAAVASLALGVGANTTVFSLVYALMFQPPPFREPDRLVLVNEISTHGPGELQLVSAPNARDWRRQGFLSEMALFSGTSMVLADASQPEHLEAVATTANFFDVTGVAPRLGRAFLPGEDGPGAAPTAILSHGFWQRRFAGDPAVLGRDLVLDGTTRRVVGVMPPVWFLMWDTDVWVPRDFSDETDRGQRMLSVLGRIRDGMSLSEARVAMAALGERLAEAHPGSNRDMGIHLWSLTEDSPGSSNRLTLFALLGIVGAVLLLACANIATMLLARSASRSTEIAVRMALGAPRLRLVRQLLAESVLLGLMGALLGLALAYGSKKAILVVLPPDFHMILRRGLEPQVLVFAFMIAFAASLVFGLAPALRTSRPALGTALKRVQGRFGRGRFPHALASSEMALAFVLLVATGLLMQSLLYVRKVDPGFEVDNLLTLTVGAGPVEHLLERLAEVPGVESVSATSWLPRSRGPMTLHVRSSHEPGSSPESGLGVIPIAVAPEYFQTLRVPVVRGRDFDFRDHDEAPPVVIVSHAVAKSLWSHGDAVGRRLWVGGAPREVVGVVADVMQERMPGRGAEPVYLPLAQEAQESMSLVVRTRTLPSEHVETLLREIRTSAPGLPVPDPRTMEAHIADQFVGARVFSGIFACFALLALALAAAGVYGVVSYTVARRTRELGVRMAFGAGRGDVMRMVLRQSLSLAVAGVGAGLLAAVGVGRWLESLLYGIGRLDPPTFAGTAAVLVAVACLAALFPALRATRIDPVESLRWE